MTDPKSIEDLMSIWDQAQQSHSEFKSQTPVKTPEKRSMPNFHEDEFEHGDPYFNYLDNPPEDLLQESATDNKKKTEKTGNPVAKYSLGKDSNPKIWVDEESLAEVEKMKRKLYELECKLNHEDGGAGKWVEKCHHPKDEAIWNQIQKLKGEIDDLGNTLGLNYEPETSLYDNKK